jgi:hypothetical protein
MVRSEQHITDFLPQKVKKNQDDLKELCQTSMEIVIILEDQLSSHGNTPAMKLKGLCEELEWQVSLVCSTNKFFNSI